MPGPQVEAHERGMGLWRGLDPGLVFPVERDGLRDDAAFAGRAATVPAPRPRPTPPTAAAAPTPNS
ncbi:hypothetical protein GS449_10160 [Rhodococcus hoagii]|nr:hypothetical protein [Prescottella equi]